MTSQVLQTTIKAHVDFFTAHAEQFRLALPLWRLLAEGSPVSLEHLANVSHRSLDETQAQLPSLDVRLDQEGKIVAGGVSLLPTRHQVQVGEQELFVWCALDTLMLPAILGRTARVISTCPVTGKAIRLTVTPESISDLSEARAVVSARLPGEETAICNVQEDLCNDGFFFVSHEVAATWPHLHPQAVLLTVEEAAELGRGLATTIRSIAGEQEPQRHR